MSLPRQILPNRTCLISRRALRRYYLLRPDHQTNNLFVYLLAVLTAEYEIVVHALSLLSTHEHIVLTDKRGNLPDFLQELHRLMALAMKVYRKWEGPLWDSERPSMVVLNTPQAIIEKIAYVMANPTAVGAVRYAEQWPGIVTRNKDLGKGVLRAERPEVFFDQRNVRWPEHATLRLQLPEGLENHFSDPCKLIKEESERLQQQARKELAARGRHFLGAERVLKISPYQRATSWEEIRDLNPSFAVGRGQSEARKLAIAALRAFRRTYRTALELWRGGDRTAAFPPGTWWMRTFHGVVTADWG